jgi:hypothetical protein
LHDNLLRLYPLTDHNWLRSRLRTFIVLHLSLISLELIRLLAALSGNALLDPDIRFPNVPLRFSPKVSIPTTLLLWFAPVSLVDHGSGALRTFRFPRGFALHVSLDDGGAGTDIDGRARARRRFKAIRSSFDVEPISSSVADFKECARAAALVLDGLDSAGCNAVSLDCAIATTRVRITTADCGTLIVGGGVSVSAPATINDPFSRGLLGHLDSIVLCLL